jgi:uncharacterized protein YgiM (DUF1202 family)
MKKNKRALLSMIVFMTVFCLTFILNIQNPFIKSKEDSSHEKDVVTTESDNMVKETQDARIQSFSYSANETTALGEPYLASVETYEDASIDLKASVSEANETTADMSVEETNQSDEVTEYNALSETAADNMSAERTAAKEEAASDDTDIKDNAVEEPEAKYANIGISIAKDYVNIRKEASTDSSVLGKLYRDSAAKILDTKGDWYYVESGDMKGYVNSEYIKTGIPDDEIVKKYGTKSISVAVDGLNVREKASTDSKKVTVIYMNEVYPVLEIKDDWVKIKIEDENVSGYVKTEFAELIVDFKEAISKEEEEKLRQIEEEERIKNETEVKYNGGVSYSSFDLKLLACLIHSEAGTQNYEGKLAVANVVLNRVKSSKYPDNIKNVIYQSGQFSVASSGSLQKQLDRYDSYSSSSQKLSIKAAKDALEGANNIGNRMHFHSYRAAANKGYDKKSNAVKVDDQLFW